MANLSYQSKTARAVMIGLVFLYFTVFILLPVGAMFAGAFTKGWPAFWRELTRPEAMHALFLTFVITAIVTVLNAVFGVILAILLVRHRWPGLGLLRRIADLPFAVSPVVAGFMLIILYGPRGILGTFFAGWGVKVVYALPGMVLATLFVTLPFVIKEVSLVLQEIGTEQEQAATILGASPWHIFWRITLPGIRWGLLYGLTLTVARSLGEFGAVLVVSGNVINRTQTATLHIYQTYADFNYLGSYAVAAFLAIISFTILISLELIKKKKGAAHNGH